VDIPRDYLALNWPIRVVCPSEDLDLVAVAGRRGFVIGNLHTNQWRCFGNLQQEQNHVVHHLMWFSSCCVLACSMPAPASHGEVPSLTHGEGGRVLRFCFYPRHHLDERSKLHSFSVPLTRHVAGTGSSSGSSGGGGGLVQDGGAVISNCYLPTVGQSYQETTVLCDDDDDAGAVPTHHFDVDSSSRVLLHKYWLYVAESPHFLTVSRVIVFVEENKNTLVTKIMDLEVQHVAKVCLLADVPPMVPERATVAGIAAAHMHVRMSPPPRIQSPIRLVDCVEVMENGIKIAVLDAKDDLFCTEIRMPARACLRQVSQIRRAIVVSRLRSLSCVATNIFHILHQDHRCPVKLVGGGRATTLRTRHLRPHETLLCDKPLRCYFLMGSHHHHQHDERSCGTKFVEEHVAESAVRHDDVDANSFHLWLWTPALSTFRLEESGTAKGVQLKGHCSLLTKCDRFGSSFIQHQIWNGSHPMMRGLVVTTQFEQYQWQLKGGSSKSPHAENDEHKSFHKETRVFWPIFEIRTSVQTVLHQVLRHYMATLYYNHQHDFEGQPFKIPDEMLGICRERAIPVTLFSGNNGCIELLVEAALQEYASEKKGIKVSSDDLTSTSAGKPSFSDVFLDFAICVLLDDHILTDEMRLALIARLARKIVDVDKLRVLFSRCKTRPEDIFEESLQKGFVETAASILLLSSRDIPDIMGSTPSHAGNGRSGDMTFLQRDHECALRLFATIFLHSVGNTSLRTESNGLKYSDLCEKYQALALSIFRFASELESIMKANLEYGGKIPGAKILNCDVSTIDDVCDLFEVDFDRMIL
jgi:hypothetical protein